MEKKLSESQLKMLSSEELAYLGDSVFELCVRSELIYRGYRNAKPLVNAARRYVSAPNQTKIYEKISSLLTTEEQIYFKRGRNQKHKNIPKHSTAKEYSIATGLESVFGYLFLQQNFSSIEELIQIIFDGERNK